MLSTNFSLLDSDQTLTFAQRTISIFKGIDPNNDIHNLTPFVLSAEKAYKDYSAAYERESKNPYTVLLAEGDAERDSGFLGFRTYIEACSYSRKSDWKEAALTLLEVIRKYGWSSPYLGYKAQTAAVTGMMDEIDNKYMSEITLLAATEWYETAKTTQSGFEKIQKESLTNAGNEPTLLETRPVLVKKIRSLITYTELQYTEHSENAELAGYIKALKELISLTMTSARANETRREKEKKKAEEEVNTKAQSGQQ